MTRTAIPGSPVEEEHPILPQTRPDELVISATNLTNVRKILRAEGIVSAHSTDAEIYAALDADPDLKKKVLADFGAKYLFPAGDDNAARVDLINHKQNVENFTKGDGRVYLPMEGSLKTAAVLTALESTGRLAAGESVIGVPSVTLWNSKELDWAGKQFLKGREVVLIPDADGVTNPMVVNQARALQARLESYGAKVIVAAPPLGKNDSIQSVSIIGKGGQPETEKLKGVDDFLGAGTGSLGGMTFVDRVVKTPTANDIAFMDGAPSRTDGIKSVADALRAISLVAGPSGTVKLGSRSIGAAINKSHVTAQSAVEYLERMGLVKTERLHELGPKRIQELVDQGVLPRVRDEKTGAWKLNSSPETITFKGDTFELSDELKSPVITIVNPEHRAVDSGVTFLEDRIGVSGRRVVRTPEGSERYGVPIGALIPEGEEEE